MPQEPLRGMRPVLYHDRLVALAGETGFHVIDPELSENDVCLVLLMCLYVSGAQDGEFDAVALSHRAESWAEQTLVELELSRPPGG